MIDDLNDAAPPPAGAPAYMLTFADLMSLLLCFFVLLLSFAQIDVEKFKAIAASMQKTMGIREVQIDPNAQIVLTNTPQEEPKPPAFATPAFATPAEPIAPEPEKTITPEISPETVLAQAAELEQQETEALATQLAGALINEIGNEKIELEAQGRQIIIRLRESGSFELGSDVVQPDFQPTLARIRQLLADTPGQISVSGHTDSTPIHTDRFRSNWDLSSARAVSVAHELMLGGVIKPQRIRVSGHADTIPVDSSTEKDAGKRNRRVEIIVER